MAPIQIEQPYNIVYLHSYAQDSPWFSGLSNHKILANRDPVTGYTYATPRGHDMYSGAETEWIDITENQASIHAFTVCHFGSEAFLDQTPFVLVLVQFEGADTLLLSRLLGVDPMEANLDWIGMKLKPEFIRNSKLQPTDVYFLPA
ncbi:MAG: nucleotide-binding protein [Anaerolineales bacterium]|nr:MAG: nucleotide-binding protein [Anaerolineales bacterium]